MFSRKDLIWLPRRPANARNGYSRLLRRVWCLKLGTYVSAVFLVGLFSLSCSYNRELESRTQSDGGQHIQSQFLLGGWTIPLTERAGPFTEELKPFVISNEDELNEFLTGLRLFRIRGRFESLSEIDYQERVILAAYFLWRPLKGLPLSLDSVRLSEVNEVLIDLRLEEVPGRESPYLAAPFHMVSIHRAALPEDGLVKFVYLLNGNKVATIISTAE